MWCTLLIFTVICVLIYLLKQLCGIGANKVTFYFKFFIFCIWGCLISILVIPYSLLRPKYAGNMIAYAVLLELVNPLLGLVHKIRDVEFLLRDGGAVVVANHQTLLDTLVGPFVWKMVKYRYNINIIMKKEIFYWFAPFGICAYLGGNIFIDRSNPKDAYNLLQAAKEKMLVKKNKIWMFPEGTRNSDCTKLLPFRKGAFNLAVDAQVPIMPVVISPYYFINWETKTFNKGHVIVQCLEPIPTKTLTRDDVPALTKQVHDKMNEAYKKLAKEVLP